MSIEIKSKLDYESYRNFARFTLFRGKGYKIGPALVFGMFLITIPLSLFRGIFIHDTYLIKLVPCVF